MGTMDQLLLDNWKSAQRIVNAESRKWFIPEHDRDDVFQETMARVLRYPHDSSKARDPEAFLMTYVRMNARTVLARLRGYHNGDKRPRSPKAVGEQGTMPVGLYQTFIDGVSGLLDERILPTVASAEDAYMASLPSKRQQALRAAVETLPERVRLAVVHQYYEELSVAESAVILGVSHKQVYDLRSEGTRALKRRLNPKGKNND